MNFYPMTVADTIDYLSFFAFKCNGTSVLAEIHRTVMSNTSKYYKFMKEECSCFYEFLCKTNFKLCPDRAVGSCTDPRYTFCAGSNNTDWALLRGPLLRLIKDCRMAFENKQSMLTLRKEVSSLIDSLLNQKSKNGKKLFCGAGPMNVNHFVHGASLLGLLPLGAYLHAEIRGVKLGPGKIMNLCCGNKNGKSLKPKECTDILYNVRQSFTAAWSNLVTVNFMENGFCYCYRTYSNTVKALPPLQDGQEYSVDVIMDDELRKESKTKNVYYIDEKRGQVQNFFNLRICGSNSSQIKPVLMMKNVSKWKDGDKANVVLTNWLGDKNDKGLLFWDCDDYNLSLGTMFQVSDIVENIYSLTL